MKTKHTPGNWTHSDGSIYSESDPSGKDIATINKNGNTTEEEEHANGELIAAAPDLLDALQSITETLHQMRRDNTISGMLMVAELAIKKATA